jgi:hypothetical protein
MRKLNNESRKLKWNKTVHDCEESEPEKCSIISDPGEWIINKLYPWVSLVCKGPIRPHINEEEYSKYDKK